MKPKTKSKPDLRRVFDEIEKIRKRAKMRAKKVPGVTTKSLIEEGRR